MDKQLFLKKLQNKKPKNFLDYDYSLLPETFLATDNIKIRCFKHGDFIQKAGSHLFGIGCFECGKEKSQKTRAITTDEFIRKSKARFSEKYNYTKTVYSKKDIALTITCPTHGDISITPAQHRKSKHGCHKCDFEILRIERKNKLLEKANRVFNNKYDYSKIRYVNSNSPVEIVCPVHGSFWQGLFSHSGTAIGCPSCARIANKGSLKTFIFKARAIHGNTYGYDKVKYDTNNSKVIITCPKHGDFIQKAASHLAGCKCKKCFLEEQRTTTEEFVKAAKLVHGDKFDYSRVDYRGNKCPVEIICPKHGSFWLKPNSHTSSGSGCRFCQESKGERAVELCLKKYGINHIREYRILPHLYRYDFYLPEFNIYIEYNGKQHYRPIEIFGGKEAFQKTKENDKYKQMLVKISNGHLIIIPFTCLNDDVVEKEVIRSLKRIYRYWFIISGKIRVFRTALDLCNFFKLPPKTRVEDFVSTVQQLMPDTRILF